MIGDVVTINGVRVVECGKNEADAVCKGCFFDGDDCKEPCSVGWGTIYKPAKMKISECKDVIKVGMKVEIKNYSYERKRTGFIKSINSKSFCVDDDLDIIFSARYPEIEILEGCNEKEHIEMSGTEIRERLINEARLLKAEKMIELNKQFSELVPPNLEKVIFNKLNQKGGNKMSEFSANTIVLENNTIVRDEVFEIFPNSSDAKLISKHIVPHISLDNPVELMRFKKEKDELLNLAKEMEKKELEEKKKEEK